MWRTVVIGVSVHLLLLSSVFDIYFTSPIQHGMTPHKSYGTPPADRVVLIVADGLRCASLYGEQMKTRAPYLFSVMNNLGSWGVSHTQVPTESRPGHIAILAGFNEDPSAITKGWKTNPVDFDSVINQSTNAWCWGSPDIVDIFNKDHLPHIHLYSYDPYMQDFSGKNSTILLDEWVFDRVQEFIVKQEQDGCTDFCERGNVIFLHLLGLDTAGHSFKPESSEYIENIKAVDNGVYAIVQSFERFFQDKATSYIFTSDHGMTNWGSHGDGSDHETEVPFIVWGAGIKQESTRQDTEQADIAPLISSLLGIPIPINSLGIIPINVLSMPDSQKAHIMRANARQLAEQYIIKHETIKANVMPWFFQPFPKLTEKIFTNKRIHLGYLAERRLHKDAINASYELIALCKEGLKYYLAYYQRILLTFISIGFVGWLVYLFISVANLGTIAYNQAETKIKDANLSTFLKVGGIFYGLFFLICFIVYVQSLPWKYYFYCTFPLLTWYAVIRNYQKGLIMLSLLSSYSLGGLLFSVVFYAAGIELMFASFFDRRVLTVILIFIAYQITTLNIRQGTIKIWVASQLLFGMCPIALDMQTRFSHLSHLCACMLWIYYEFEVAPKNLPKCDKRIIKYQFRMLNLAFLNSWMVHITITAGSGLWLINQLTSWILLSTSLCMPLFVTNLVESRLISSVLSLIIPYTLMGVGHENMFVFFFAHHMINWTILEKQVKYVKVDLLPTFYTNVTSGWSKYTDWHTVRRCFYLLTFIMLGYFGVGNTARINSFDPMWTRCFITVFSPFTMASLILIKLIIPFLIVLCSFRIIVIVTSGQIRNCFLIILLFSDLMVIQLLYFVKNEGSWLEIGVSLSRFIVASITTIILTVLYQIAFVLTSQCGYCLLDYLPIIMKTSIKKVISLLK